MKPVMLTVGAAGVLVGIGTLELVRDSPGGSYAGRSVAAGMALVGTAWLVIAIGLVAWRRSGDRRYGPLLVAAGFTWLVAEWNNFGAGSALVFTIGLALYAACPSLVAHAALVYPHGRVATYAERVMLAAGYTGTIVLLGLLPAVFFDPEIQSCALCPGNLLAVTGEPEVVATLTNAGSRFMLGWALVLAVLLVWRLYRSTPAARLVAAPVLVPAAAYLCLVAVSYWHVIARGTLAIDSADRQLRLAQAVALTALAGGVALEWVRARRARSAVAALVVELGDAPPPGGLRDALAAALGDPDLIIAYPVGGGRLVNANGHAIDQPNGGEAATELVRDGRPIARLLHRRDLRGHPSFIKEAASAASLALDNERLHAEVRAQLADLRASRARIVEGSDDERRRLERDLHDGAQQRLVGLALGMRLLRSRSGADSVPSVLDEAEAQLRAAIADLRQVARGLYPAVLTQYGLAAALEALAEEAAGPVRLSRVPEQRLPPPTETAAYFLVAEAAKTGPVRVSADVEDAMLVINVEAARRPELLVDIEDRVGALGGWLTVEDEPEGTVRLRAEVPCG